MTTRIAILGAGPGGYTAAVRAAQAGAEVTVIEKDNAGGTCLNRGCIPSKVMITTAELLEKIKKAQSYGIALEGSAHVDMQALLERKNRIVKAQTDGIINLLKHNRVTYMQGTGLIKGNNLAAVRTAEGKEQEIAWDKLIVAAGTRPFELPEIPFDGERIISSDHALNLRQVPESVLIVGGGVIGCEFAFLLSALGSTVTVVEALPRMLPLPSVDEDCSKVLQREMKKRKIGFMVNSTVAGAEEKDGKLNVEIRPSPFAGSPSKKDPEPSFHQVDKILVCIGRTPVTPEIKGLDSLGVQTDEKGWILANETMVTANPDVYAVGDILGPSKIMLAHSAWAEGMTAAQNAMGGGKTMDYNTVPGAIFTSPEVANVGLTEAQAGEEGYSVRADSALFRPLGKAQAIGEIAGQAKIISETGSGKLLGVHIIGPHATDLIAEAALALKMKATVRDLAETVHAHPTLPEIIMETSMKAMDQPFHG
ncbi:MAG: dihydrolipoyl dehydrogenase [Desulfosalsimonas sp.]